MSQLEILDSIPNPKPQNPKTPKPLLEYYVTLEINIRKIVHLIESISELELQKKGFTKGFSIRRIQQSNLIRGTANASI